MMKFVLTLVILTTTLGMMMACGNRTANQFAPPNQNSDGGGPAHQ